MILAPCHLQNDAFTLISAAVGRPPGTSYAEQDATKQNENRRRAKRLSGMSQ